MPSIGSSAPRRWTLDSFAKALQKDDDPKASDRVNAIAEAIRSGKTYAEQIDGIPVMASMIPAWWVKRNDVYEIRIIVLGKKDAKHDISLVKEDGQLVHLSTEPMVRVFPVAEGLWVYSYKSYMDDKWMQLGNEASLGSSDAEELYPRESIRRFEQLKQRDPDLSLIVGDERLPLVIGRWTKPPTTARSETENGVKNGDEQGTDTTRNGDGIAP